MVEQLRVMQMVQTDEEFMDMLLQPDRLVILMGIFRLMEQQLLAQVARPLAKLEK